MDLKMVNKALAYTHKRKKWVLVMAALGFSTYAAYKVSTLPSVAKKRAKAIKFFSAFASLVQFLGDSADSIGVIPKDLKHFLQSDSDQIPTSITQLFKITKSDGFSESIVRVTRALTEGVRESSYDKTRKGVGSDDVDDNGFADRALDKLFTPAGYGFASVVVGSLTKNMVMAIYATDKDVTTTNSVVNGSKNSVEKWVDVVAHDDKCRKLVADCIQQFVSTMVTVYLDKTMDINPYEQIFSGLSNPNHEEKARDLLTMVCNGAIETFVKTSHQVLTNSNANGGSGSGSGSVNVGKVFDGKELVLSKPKARNDHDNGRVSQMSSSLANPGNMRFVLDVTGRVAIATTKSLLGFSMNRLSEGMKKSGQDAYRYLTAEFIIVMTICISLYLHLLSTPWTLESA